MDKNTEFNEIIELFLVAQNVSNPPKDKIKDEFRCIN